MTYEAKVIAGGKVVIPAKLRREMELAVGDRLIFEKEGDRIVLKTFAQVVREIQQNVAKYVPEGISLADELIAERRDENARDEEETRRWLAERK